MSTTAENEAAFRQFRPYCLVLVKSPNKEALDKLAEICRQADPDTLTKLQEYLIFPQQVYLKTPVLPSNYTLAVINFVSSFYRLASLDTFFILKDVMGALLLLVAPPKGERSVDEDLKSASVNCLAQMIKSSVVSVREELYSEPMKLPLSHLIFLILSWTESEKSPTLRQDCLKLLKTLLEQGSTCRGGFKPLFQGLLPGILSKLAKLCQDPATTQSSLKALAINVWSGYVAEIFSDNNRSALEEPWIEKAQIQIQNQLNIIQSFSSHSDRRIKEALLICAERLMFSCWNILENSRMVVLNILVVSCLDENSTISVKADTLIDRYIEACSGEREDLVLKVNDKLTGLSKDIKHSLGLYSEKVLYEKLSLVSGYLNLITRLQDQATFFHSKAHLSLLVQNLVRLTQLSEHQASILPGSLWTSTSDLDFLFHPHHHLPEGRPGKSYRYLTSPSLQQLLSSICTSLSCTEAFPIIVKYLLQSLQELDYLKREAMIILNLVIAGRSTTETSAGDHNEVIDNLLPVMYKYLELKPVNLKNVIAALNSDRTEVIPLNTWSETLLAVEGLGLIAKAIGPQFRCYQPEVLLYSLSSTALDNPLAVHVLYQALLDTAGGERTVPQLLTANIDHLSKDLNLMLRQRQTGQPGLPTLLRLVLRLAPAHQDREDMNDTIESLALNLALADQDKVQEMLDLVRVFVTGYQDLAQEKRAKQENSDSETETEKKTGAEEEGRITNLLLNLEQERIKELQETEELLHCPPDGLPAAPPAEEDVADPEDGPPEESTQLTLDQHFLKTVLDHVRHFVSMAGRPTWQLSALESCAACLDLLARTAGQSPGEKQETLLPLVHQVWSPLHLLFKSNNIFIVDKAFDCLQVIATHARDFVHKRTVTDVLPPLLNFFRMLETMTKDRERQNTLAASQSRRILNKMVSGIWNLLDLLDLSPLETDPVIELLLVHLQDKIGRNEDDISTYLQPKRNLDANILYLKLNHR